VTGLVDAFSCLVLGHVFVAHMTRNVVFAGIRARRRGRFLHLPFAVRLGAFCLGGACWGRLAIPLVGRAESLSAGPGRCTMPVRARDGRWKRCGIGLACSCGRTWMMRGCTRSWSWRTRTRSSGWRRPPEMPIAATVVSRPGSTPQRRGGARLSAHRRLPGLGTSRAGGGSLASPGGYRAGGTGAWPGRLIRNGPPTGRAMRRSGPPPLSGWPTLLRPREILDLGESAVEAIREPDRGLVVGPQTPPPGTKLSASSIKESMIPLPVGLRLGVHLARRVRTPPPRK
jgi:hypothetical protein